VRIARKMTQAQVGRIAKMTRATLSYYEHGKQNISLLAIARIADALETTVERLCKGF